MDYARETTICVPTTLFVPKKDKSLSESHESIRKNMHVIELYVKDGSSGVEMLINYVDGGDKEFTKFFFKLLHDCVSLACGKKKDVDRELSDPDQEKSIFDLVNTSDLAYVFLIIFNNYVGWSKRATTSDISDPIHKKNVGRWTCVQQYNEAMPPMPPKNDEQDDDDDMTTSTAPSKGGSSSKTSTATSRATNSTGWSDEGLDVHHKARVFFDDLRKHARYNDVMVMGAREYWHDNVLMKRRDQNKDIYGNKRKRGESTEMEAPMFDDLLDFMGGR